MIKDTYLKILQQTVRNGDRQLNISLLTVTLDCRELKETIGNWSGYFIYDAQNKNPTYLVASQNNQPI